jgi:replicative DNA helicase
MTEDRSEDEVEQLLLVERTIGLAMINPTVMERLVRAGVSSAEFEHEAHSTMFSTMVGLFASHMRCDAGMVEARLRDVGWRGADAKRWVRAAEDAGRSAVVDDETVTTYIDRIRVAAARRRLRALARDVIASTEPGRDEGVSSLASRIVAEVESIVAGSTSTRTKSAADLASGLVKRLEQERDNPVVRAPLGVRPIDEACRGGPRLGSVLVFGADTGVGKTTFLRHFLLSMLRAGRRVAVFTFEASSEQIFDGLAEMTAGLRLGNVSSTSSGWSRLEEATAWLHEQPLWIHDSEAMTVEELASKVHSFVKRERVDVVLVDYVQDIERSTKHARDDLNFMHISKTLRRLTQRYPLLLVENAQLNDDDGGAAGGKRKAPGTGDGPTERNLAFTKQWAKDASYILMAHRPKLSEDDVLRDVTSLRLIKNRHEGKLARAWMKYDQTTTRLADCDAHGRVEEAAVRAAQPVRVEVEVPDDDDDVEAEWERMTERMT